MCRQQIVYCAILDKAPVTDRHTENYDKISHFENKHSAVQTTKYEASVKVF